MSGNQEQKQLRVLHVISSLDPRAGGTVACLMGWVSALARAGVNVDLASTWSKGDDQSNVQYLQRAGVNVHLIGPAVPRVLSWHKDIPSILTPLIEAADVVHIHALWEEIQYQAARIAQRIGKPYVITPHGMLDPWSLSQGRLKKRAYLAVRLQRNLDRAAAVHYTCQEERDLAARLGIAAPALVETLGLELSEFETLPEKGSFRLEYPQLGNRPIILFLARLHPKKGADLLIKAFALAFPDSPDAPALVLAGPDSEGHRAELEQLAEVHHVSGRVVFTGMLRGRNRIAAMADADLFALTSHQENFGIAVVESLAAGTPVLISDQVNIHREITRGGVGVTVPLDIPTIANELRLWMADGGPRVAAAAQARKWAWDHCNWDTIAQSWIGHYRRLSTAPQSMPTRILHVISSLNPGGGGPVFALQGLANAQHAHGLRVSVAASWCGDPADTVAPAMQNLGIPVTLIGPTHTRLQWHVRTGTVLRALIAQADIVHIHGIWEDIQHQAAAIARELCKPYIIRPCGMLDPWSLTYHRARKRLGLAVRVRRDLQEAAALHFTAESERDLTKPLQLRCPAIIVPNGLDFDQYRSLPARGSFRGRYPQIGNRPVVLFLSRIHPKKGLDILLPAFAQASAEIEKSGGGANARPMLIVAGSDCDGYETDVKALAEKLQIGQDVLFVGPLYNADKIAAYVDADLFCLPSYQENFGNVLIESLAAGTPVLISDQVNIYREIQAAQVGWVEPTGVSAFADALVRILTHAEERRAAAGRAHNFVWSRYDWNQIAWAWAEHYQALLGRTSQVPGSVRAKE